MKLLWIDLETTGLDPRKDDVLEVGWATSTIERPFEIGEVNSRLIQFRWMPSCWDAKVREMHEKNGLLAAHARAKKYEVLYLAEVEKVLLALAPEVYDYEDRTVIAGASVGPFDLQFLRNVMPTLASRLSHRAYDVSAIKLFYRSLGMPKLPRGEAHRAAADVLESVEHARLCAEWLKQAYVANEEGVR